MKTGDCHAGSIIAHCILIISITVTVLSGCLNSIAESGTLTIRLTGAADYDDCEFRYEIEQDVSETDTDSLTSAFSGSATIRNGTAAVTVTDSSGLPFEFTGGRNLTVDVFIDGDGNDGDTADLTDYQLDAPVYITIDGDQEITFSCPDDFIMLYQPSAAVKLFHNETELFNGSILGDAFYDIPMQFEIALENSGDGMLDLGDSPEVLLSSSSYEGFSISQQPQNSIMMPDEMQSFYISLLSPATGYKYFGLKIYYNNPGLSPYTCNLAVNVIKETVHLPATGQLTEVLSGDDGFYHQGVSWPAERFIDNANGTVTDALTGLMWESDPVYSTSLPSGYLWDYAVTYSNNLEKGGYDDWHLPNVNELMSLVTADTAAPASWLNSFDGFTGIRSSNYWTSTYSHTADYTAMAFVVHADDGGLWRLTVNSISNAFILAVRNTGTGLVELPVTGKTGSYRTGDDGDLEEGASWPYPRFIMNNGTVIDVLTGLQWKQSPEAESMTWNESISHIENLDYAGYTDWRLPNRNEMRSLISYNSITNEILLGNNFGTTIPEYKYWWTSTTHDTSGSGDSAWVIYLTTGTSDAVVKTENHYCWAVR